MNEPEENTQSFKKITAIKKDDVHRICSGQVIIDLAIALKELVENSLDSGATAIEIRLTNFGQTCISINDNGSGILESDFEGFGLKHHTSKLREFSDLTEVGTFGFRGEAINSLCSLSDLSIVTRHSSYQYGFYLEFDKNGILQKKEISAREPGTTVIVRNIFKNLPVRAKEFQRNIKKEYSKAIQVLYSYCLVCTGIKIVCYNVVGNASKLIFSTSGCKSILENISSIFGAKIRESLVQIEAEVPNKETLEEFNLSLENCMDFSWECFVSKCDHAYGRSCPDRQFFYINGRPCCLTKINKIINQIYHKYNVKKYPFIFFNLILNQECTDINVTPDKRTIFLTQEKFVLAAVKYNFTKTWEDMQGTLIVRNLNDFNNINKRSSSTSPKMIKCELPVKKKMRMLEANTDISEIKKLEIEDSSIMKTDNISEKDACNEYEEYTIELNKEIKLRNVKMEISIVSIKEKMSKKKYRLKNCASEERCLKYKIQLGTKTDADAVQELQRELTKKSFIKMDVIGQFNLGFIISKLDNDLFIVDQHATDEKYRFEKLNRETKLRTQKLIIPKILSLETMNETLLLENQAIFEKNGFTFRLNEEGEPGQRVELTGMPVSGTWQFNESDIEELIFLIREDADISDTVPRPSRIRQMLASRACRSAIMIGTALNMNDMRRCLTQMTEMLNPWNCPHGRPTIRHLFSLSVLK